MLLMSCVLVYKPTQSSVLHKSVSVMRATLSQDSVRVTCLLRKLQDVIFFLTILTVFLSPAHSPSLGLLNSCMIWSRISEFPGLHSEITPYPANVDNMASSYQC